MNSPRSRTGRVAESRRVVCGHDCPDGCSLIVTVEDGRLTRVRGDPDHPFTAGFACAKVHRDHELVYSPQRLRTPLRRAGPKGSGEFVPIDWQEALDEIESRWKTIIRESGPLAILGYAYSAHMGQFNRGLISGLFHALGTSRLDTGTVCDSCADAAWTHTLGEAPGADPESVLESELVVAWGADLQATNVHFWALVEKARAKGARLVVIDPRRTRAARVADLYLPVRVGTDAALALGVMHILARDGLLDRDYLSRHTLGFERVEQEVLPDYAPLRVAEITGLDAADIERFASMYGATKRSFIRLGFGMSRMRHGGMNLRTVALLPGTTGAYGCRGGGALLATVAAFGLNFAALRQPSGAAQTRSINHLRLGRALLELDDPPIRALFVAANNPAVTNPDQARLRRGLMREDLFTVVHDPFLSQTARYADIVLPSTTYLETEDFYRSYGSYYMQYAPRAVEPQHQSWSNLKLARELARRMDLTDAVFGMNEHELLRELFRDAHGAVAAFDPDSLPQAGPVSIARPAAQVFTTPSGKLEFESATLAALELPALPRWQTDPGEAGANGRLRLLTAPGYFQNHTAFSGVASLRAREGAPFAVMHPDDAGKRGLSDGQQVRIFNECGTIGLILRVRDEVRPGTLLVPGQRPDQEAVSGTINLLCGDEYTDMGEGASYQSTWLDVEAW